MTTKRSLIRRATAVAAAATPASPSASAPAQQGEHNAADVAFAQGMITHHQQAIEMADLAATRAEIARKNTLPGKS